MSDIYRDRHRIIQLIFAFAAFILLAKAMYIQVIDTSQRERANATAIGSYTQYPSRGLIYDRNGKLLVNNNPIYDLMVTYSLIDENMDTTLFCSLLDIDKASFIKQLDKNFRSNRFSKRKPFVFMDKLSSEIYAGFQEHLYRFPGFFVQLRNARGYPHQNAAHALGFLNEVNKSQVAKSNGLYKGGDYIGASGLEKKYETELRGKKGVKNFLKDNLGRIVGPYRDGKQDTMAISGKDMISSIDLDLQAYGELLMQNKTGSIVAIEPKTGEVLAMLSAPGYDPNDLTINRYRSEAFHALLNDTLTRPFLDRSISAKYPPGSIFKTIVSLVAMQEGVLAPDQGYSCNGSYNVKGTGKPRKCHNHAYAYNTSVALQHSCNTFYFHVIRNILEVQDYYNPEVGLNMFNEYLYQFGLGQTLGIDIPNEKSGNVPSVDFYNYLYRNQGGWKSPTIMSIGIGQGEIEMTTLQMANLAAIMANRGHWYPPHLVKGFRNDTTQIPSKYRQKRTVKIDDTYFNPVIKGMELVVTKGTGRAAQTPNISIAGKTGTSQNPHGIDHSVFFAFAPIENPKIAIAVYVEHGKWGSDYGAPMAGLMIEKYLKREISEQKKAVEQKMIDANLIDNP